MRKPVFAGDLHQIGGLPEHARDFLVLQTGFLHPIVSGRIGPFGSAARRLQYAAHGRVFSVVFLTFLAVPVAMAQSATIHGGERGELRQRHRAGFAGHDFRQQSGARHGHRRRWMTNGNCPPNSASTRVEINGVAAALFFVSPGQINLVVPAGLTPGTATVVIRSTATGSTQNGTALVQHRGPGRIHERCQRERSGRDSQRHNLRARALSGADRR